MKSLFTILLNAISFLLLAAPANTTEFIKINQIGYRLLDQKVAVIANPMTGYNAAESFSPGTVYEVRRWTDDQVVFSGSLTAFNGGATHIQSGDQVWWFDFSSLNVAGEYYIYDATNDVGSYQFTIADDVYIDLIKQSLKTYYYQRCGVAKSATHGGAWTDGVCHHGAGQDLACRAILDPTNSATELDLSGGWHDAGDYNKYTTFTYSTVHALLFAYMQYPGSFGDDNDIPESGNGIPDILDEVMFELDWLKKMQKSDGSVLSKVSVTNFQAASPPSADSAPRYYGEATASSTATTASVFAHAYLALKDFPSLLTYANDLKDRAEDAWNWIDANPAYSNYNNAGFASVNPEQTVDVQKEVRVGAAMLLFAATSDFTYRAYAENNYMDIRPVTWNFWYPFQATIQDIALYYTSLPAAQSVATANILASFESSTSSSNADMLPAWQANTDAYRAYLKDNDYVWGSNQAHANAGILFANMNYYNLDQANSSAYTNASLGYLHYLLGVNPMSKVMLTNASSLNAENSCDEMYHGWFGDGTAYDNAQTSTGPPPAFVTGGVNRFFAPDPANGGDITPPQNQPTQKSYKDWNTSWPENSWEITENAIYYQAAFIQFAATFASSAAVLPLEMSDFMARPVDNKHIDLIWKVISFDNVYSVEIERQNDDYSFQKIGEVRNLQVGTSEFRDQKPKQGENIYRLKITDFDGTINYSKIVTAKISTFLSVQVYPNPASSQLHLKIFAQAATQDLVMKLFNTRGEQVFSQSQIIQDEQSIMTIVLDYLPRGMYWLHLECEGGVEVKKVFLQ